MWNNEHERLNSRIQRHFLSQNCSTYRVHAELRAWTISSKTSWITCNSTMIRNINSIGLKTYFSRLRSWIWYSSQMYSTNWSSYRCYGHKQLNSRIKISVRNSCIQLFSFSDLLTQNLVQIYSWSQRFTIELKYFLELYS